MAVKSQIRVFCRRFGVAAALVGLLSATGEQPRGRLEAQQVAESVTGAEFLAWTQEAPSAVTVGRYRFVGYVDGVAVGLPDATCQASSGTLFECRVQLPRMTVGRHTLAVAAMDAAGITSVASAPLLLDVAGRFAVPRDEFSDSSFDSAASRAARAACSTGATFPTCFDVDVVVTGLESVSSLQWLADGRLLFVEGTSTLRMLGPEGLETAYDAGSPGAHSWRIADVVPSPDFARSGHLYLALVRTTGQDVRTEIVRGHEVGGRVGQLATVVAGLPTAPESSPALSVNSEGLYVAMPASSGRTRDVYESRILRFDGEGRAASEAGTPVVAHGHDRPADLAVDRAGRLWLAAANAGVHAAPLGLLAGPLGGRGQLPSARFLALAGWPQEASGVRALALGALPSAGVDAVYVAPESLRDLLIARLDRPDGIRFERLPLGGVEPTAVAVSADGVVFVGGVDTAAAGPKRGTLLRLRPYRQPGVSRD